MHELPRYRQRVVFPLFGLAHPTWEDDPFFDVANHVDEITIPAPGDDRAMSVAGGDVYARALDRRHPLWSVTLLQGRADGNTAAIWRIHHARVDGVSGVDLTMVLHDLTPQGDERPPAPAEWIPRPLADPITRLEDAARDRLTETAEELTRAAFRLLRPAETTSRDRRIAAALLSTGPKLMRPAPRTPFNGPLSSHRHFAWAELPFAEIRQIKSALGGTVNDTVLAIISGGLGRYMRHRGYPTESVELRTMVPVSMRRPEERGALGNLVSMMVAPLCVGILDPVERLATQRRAIEALKAGDQAGGLYELTSLARLVPPAWQAIAASTRVSVTVLNTVTTNVPGPQIPLYLAGRKLLHWYPLGPLSSTVGLFNAILSYNQVLTIGATADPALMPDVWTYTDFLRESFLELREAAERVAPRPVAPPRVAVPVVAAPVADPVAVPVAVPATPAPVTALAVPTPVKAAEPVAVS
jgi:diacylglycerol O-acyltransferase / wax synthase